VKDHPPQQASLRNPLPARHQTSLTSPQPPFDRPDQPEDEEDEEDEEEEEEEEGGQDGEALSEAEVMEVEEVFVQEEEGSDPEAGHRRRRVDLQGSLTGRVDSILAHR
jgi:hypothetical protein